MNNSEEKKRKLLKAEIIIIIVALLAILIPQLAGTTTVARESGTVKDLEDLNGKKIGLTRDPEFEEMASEMWPDSELYYADDAAELPELLTDGEIDAFPATYEETTAVLADHPDLISLITKRRNTMSPDENGEITDMKDAIYTVMRAGDFYYLATGTIPERLNEPGAKIAGITGSELTAVPAEVWPEAEVLNYDSFPDMFIALDSGKLDAVSCYYSHLELLKEYYDDIAVVSMPVHTVIDGFGTAKNEKGDRIKEEFNSFIKEISSNGKFEEVVTKWSAMSKNDDAALDYEFSGENGVLHIATNGAWFPMTYYSGDQLTGQFIEIIDMFCAEYGYQPEYEVVNYAAAVAGLNTGKYDMMADTLYITPERLENINISDPVMASDMYIAVKTESAMQEVPKATAFVNKLKRGFHNTFISGNGTAMILKGLGITLILTLFASLLGSLLGALICGLRMSRNTYANAFARIYVRLVQGVPVLVLLMVLYYIVFTSESTSALAVCILGFGMDFAAYASEIFRNGIEAVPVGQSRATKALGFTPARGFVKVILPQAMERILPVYSGQLVGLLKMTSIAGYISVMELTKVSDIIRSRTFDAFFPLITTAIIYFLLSNILIKLLSLTKGSAGKKHGGSLLKGVDMQAEKAAAGYLDEQRKGEPAKGMLVIEHLRKSFGESVPIKDVNCVIDEGDVISIIGPSGTGKSTLLNLINRLDEPDSGKIILDGEDTGAGGYDYSLLRRKVGMVFQAFNLFPHLTVVENIMLAQVEILGRSKQEAYERSLELLDMVGLADRALRYPAVLSGGQQQRVAIARTIAMDPEIILFDEPTSALDPTKVGEVVAVIRNLAQRGATMLIVTHEMRFARDVSSRVFYMDEGLVYEEGSPQQIFEAPKKEKTRQFIHRLKVAGFELDENSHDIPAVYSGIDEFAQKHMLSEKLLQGMLRVTDELCSEIIMRSFKGYDNISISFEYDQANDMIGFIVRYGGPQADPLADDAGIPVRLLRATAPDIAYHYADGMNTVEGHISE
jgi:His/Glu/Gln/Arg/opine family amino acid ABC transporter permease subunit